MDAKSKLTYGILSQDDGDKFEMGADGRLIAKGPFDDNNKEYHITVTASDGTNVAQQKVKNVCTTCLSTQLNVQMHINASVARQQYTNWYHKSRPRSSQHCPTPKSPLIDS